MKLRSITCFAAVTPGDLAGEVAACGRFLAAARARYEAAGYPVQTVRLALPAFPSLAGIEPGRGVDFARSLESACRDAAVDYVTLGPLRFDDDAAFHEVILEVLQSTQSVFAAAHVATADQGVDLAAIRRCATLIHRAARVSDDGFANLRFAALANVPPGVPFLPAAYHDGGPSRFALATEAADLAGSAFGTSSTLAEARERLTESVESHATKLEAIARELDAVSDAPRFSGIDFSLAPFPTPETSVAAALESLGLESLGASGSVAAAACLTQGLDAARFTRAGFCGLFLPVLEDAFLAARSANGLVHVEDLLLYSTVCGTGLDTVPLAGDIGVEALAAILVDVAVLSLRLSKPLTARLMPMPGKRAGDPLDFDFPYFASGRVMSHKARALGGMLGGTERFPVSPRVAFDV